MGKGGQCLGLTTLPHSVPIVLKSETLSLLEPSGPVQGCTGFNLPLPNRGTQIHILFPPPTSCENCLTEQCLFIDYLLRDCFHSVRWHISPLRYRTKMNATVNTTPYLVRIRPTVSAKSDYTPLGVVTRMGEPHTEGKNCDKRQYY